MKISSINQTFFKGNIIDSHAHIGKWHGKEYSLSNFDEFIKQPLSVNGEQDTVEKILLSNLSCIDKNGSLGEMEGNLEMLRESTKSEKFAPLAVCQPNLTGGDTNAMKKLLNENDAKFVGLKFHPKDLQFAADGKTPVMVNSNAYDKYLDLAAEKKLPCLFHSEVKVDWSLPDKPVAIPLACSADPKHIYELAKRHPKVPVILGHTGMGAGPSHKYATDILLESIDKKNALLYADISWMDWANNGLPADEKTNLINLIKELKKRGSVDRVLFGTDAPLGCYGEELKGGLSSKQAYESTVSSIKTAIKNDSDLANDADEIIDKIFHTNADELFFKKKWAEGLAEGATNPETLKKLSKGQIGAIVVGALAFTGAAIFLYKKFKKKGQDTQVASANTSAQTQTMQQAAPLQQNYSIPASQMSMNQFISKSTFV